MSETDTTFANSAYHLQDSRTSNPSGTIPYNCITALDEGVEASNSYNYNASDPTSPCTNCTEIADFDGTSTKFNYFAFRFNMRKLDSPTDLTTF